MPGLRATPAVTTTIEGDVVVFEGIGDGLLSGSIAGLYQLNSGNGSHGDQDSEFFQPLCILDLCVFEVEATGFGGGKKQLDFPPPGIPLDDLASIINAFDRVGSKQAPMNGRVTWVSGRADFADFDHVDAE